VLCDNYMGAYECGYAAQSNIVLMKWEDKERMFMP
jgi:hypothetical protein